MEMEVVELIAKFGQCKQDILTDSNKYCAVKNESMILALFMTMRKMTHFHLAFLLCQSIINKQKKKQSACKAADNAYAATAALSNVVNTSISSTAAAADSSTSSSTNANKIRASIDYTPPSSGFSSS